MDGSNLPNSCNELTIPKENFPRNSDEEVVGQNAEVSADLHADVGINNTRVAKSVSSITEATHVGNEATDDASVTNKPDETIFEKYRLLLSSDRRRYE